jgi:ribonuclease-3
VNDSARLLAALGYRFNQPGLFAQALTHRSFGQSNNERLEFLGDGVLDCVIGEALYGRFPQLPEGSLSRLRANLVRQDTLVDIARGLNIGAHLRLGEGEHKSGGATRPSILADALESLFGAVLLDGGYDAARGVILQLMAAQLDAIDPKASGKDPKTQLQEWLQGRRQPLPDYAVVTVAGQAHAQEFHIACAVGGHRSEGCGASRRAAEQEAALRMLSLLETQ